MYQHVSNAQIPDATTAVIYIKHDGDIAKPHKTVIKRTGRNETKLLSAVGY